MKKIILTLVVITAALAGLAQVSGNRVYGNKAYNNNENRSRVANEGILVDRDSIMYINASVLLNTRADHFLLVLGVNQTAKNTKDCQLLLNSRINNFTKSIPSSYNIKAKDIYTDFITQTKVYNYDLKSNADIKVASQQEIGMQTKKNIHIRFDDITILDDLLLKAAAQDIYDVIKVDYIMDDYMKLHKELLTEANKIINEKKAIYLQQSALELLPFYNVNSDNFYAVFPATQYRTYQAFESEQVNANYNYENKFLKKDVIMDKTSFYEGEDIATIDKVINSGMPEVGVQFVLRYSIKYYIKKK